MSTVTELLFSQILENVALNHVRHMFETDPVLNFVRQSIRQSSGENLVNTAVETEPAAAQPAAAEAATESCWALVEIFGHTRFAGLVSNQRVGDSQFVRIDVPQTSSGPAFVKLFSGKAIFSLTPVDEDVARRAAESFRERAVPPYLALPAPRHYGDCDDEDRDEFDDGLVTDVVPGPVPY